MLARVSCFAALGGFLFGYDIALIGGALLFMKEELSMSDLDLEMVVAFCKVGAVFGTFLGGGMMQKHGRRAAIASCAILFVFGPLIMAVSNGVFGLCLGRFLTGLGIGASSVVTPAYLGEMSPQDKRGSIVALYEVSE